MDIVADGMSGYRAVRVVFVSYWVFYGLDLRRLEWELRVRWFWDFVFTLYEIPIESLDKEMSRM